MRPPLDQLLVYLDLMNPFNEKETWDETITVVDVKARDQLGRLYNVEMQMNASGWCYFLIHGAELDKNNLPAALRNSAVELAMEVMHIMAQNDVEWERYQARLKNQRDQNMFIINARKKAEKAFNEGLKKGLVKHIHFCQRLLKLALTPQEELLALPLEELQARADELEQQAGVPKQ